MATTFTGPIVEMGEITTGTSKSGKSWTKRDVVLQHESGQYPREIQITCMNSACDALDQFDRGDVISIEASIESKPHNGKRYTNVNGFKVSRG